MGNWKRTGLLYGAFFLSILVEGLLEVVNGPTYILNSFYTRTDRHV
jgi:hypothetical protein